MPSAEYIFCCCQVGAEQALKQEVVSRAADLRFSYSRPGFVTFKLPEPTELQKLNLPRFVFARRQGLCLGRVPAGFGMQEMAGAVWAIPAISKHASAGQIHVWQRDQALPGEGSFEPGVTPLAKEVHAALVAATPQSNSLEQSSNKESTKSSNSSASAMLDVIIVDPNEWWVGWHALETRSDRWPGGIPSIELPDHAVSRAYLKMREALTWSNLPIVKGDEWVELGCAPGGASQALLDAGMYVTGIDPAEVDPAMLAEGHFRHLQMRASEVRRKELVGVKWLAADINAAPSYTLDAVEEIVSHPEAAIRGMILTLKLADWQVASPDKITAYLNRVRGWGFKDLRIKQLAFNRRELCLVALRSKAQRRVKRVKRGSRGTKRKRSKK